MNSRVVLTCLIFVLGGCAAKTPINTPVPGSPDVEQARQTGVTGQLVRWGGVVVSMQNLADYSEIEIVDRPLERAGAPKITDKTSGRFLARSASFIEPEDVEPGRYITVSGVIDSYQQGKVGEYPYRFPVVRINEFKVWPQSLPNYYYPRYYSPYWYDPFWGPYPYYGGSIYYGHHHRKQKQKQNTD